VLVLRAFAQAWIADRLGDPTPRNDGRVTLYPPPHVDLIGTVVLPLICIFYLRPEATGFFFFLAWTKPVPTNPNNFAHPRRGELFTQFAGCAMCILIATVTAIAGGLLYSARSLEIAQFLISICAMLIVLDLLPVPPLPGGMLLRHWGVISEEAFWSISRWSGIVLLIMFNLPPVRMVIGICVAIVMSPFAMLLNLIAR
jgi:Zn-dependent protease